MNHLVLLTGATCDRDDPRSYNAYAPALQEMSPGKTARAHTDTGSVLGQYFRNNTSAAIRDTVLFIMRENVKYRRKSGFIAHGLAVGELRFVFPPEEGARVCIVVLKDAVDANPAIVNGLGTVAPTIVDSFAQLPTPLSYASLAGVEYSYLPQRPCNPAMDTMGCTVVDMVTRAEIIQTSLTLACSKRLDAQFCGMQAVSMTRDILATMHRTQYAVSLKLDGTRFFMIIRDDGLFFMNRALDVWVLSAGNNQHAQRTLKRYEDSLLDVEVMPSGQTMVLDTIAIKGRSVRKDDLYKRLGASQSLLKDHFPDGFRIQYQHYAGVRELPEALIALDVNTHADGIVFTPIRPSYRLGASPLLIKWKPLNRNSVDLIYSNGCLSALDTRFNESIEIARFETGDKIPDGAVCECVFAPDHTAVVSIKQRPDRTTANPLIVVNKIMRSIRENIGPSDLLKHLYPR